MNLAVDTEYIILENIYDSAGQQSPLRQRDLAQIAGASLGMTNSILKRLAQKGWITVKKLNNRNIKYAITLEGFNEIIHRSYRYFKQTVKNLVYFKDILEDQVYQAKQKKIHTVILIGESDLDFIVEHACRRWGLTFLGLRENENEVYNPLQKSLKIYAESIPWESKYEGKISLSKKNAIAEKQGTDVFYLSRLIIKQAAVSESGEIED
jgi:DNA-binding MarR family transcriptional regulator